LEQIKQHDNRFSPNQKNNSKTTESDTSSLVLRQEERAEPVFLCGYWLTPFFDKIKLPKAKG
jgi:hypothetical protein